MSFKPILPDNSITVVYIQYTVNVEMFVLYIFSHHSTFSNIRENIYASQKLFVLWHIDAITPKTQIEVHAKLPIFVNSRKCIHVKISTFTVSDTMLYLHQSTLNKVKIPTGAGIQWYTLSTLF